MSNRGRVWSDVQFKITDAVIQKKLKEKHVVFAFRLALQDVFWKDYPQERKSPGLMKLEEDRKASATCDSQGRFSFDFTCWHVHSDCRGAGWLQ
jgi:hypothetical protein